MGGSSVPSNTTQTTLLDPVRQKGLQDASKYFNKWAATYNGPTYKGPLVAGRTQDWYTAQDMAHKMANRFSEGGITSARRFDSGGQTFTLGPSANEAQTITLGSSTDNTNVNTDNTGVNVAQTNSSDPAAATTITFAPQTTVDYSNIPSNLTTPITNNWGAEQKRLAALQESFTSADQMNNWYAAHPQDMPGSAKALTYADTQAATDKATLDKAIADANLTKPTYTATPTTTNTQSPYLIAQGLAQKGIGGIYGITDKNLTPQQISNSYTNPDQITPGTITPDMWNATAMDTYMSPYTKGVVDIALREADRQRAIERLRENTAATQSGAFGGYRQGVVEAEGERNYNQRLGDIVNTGYQNAYNNAQSQFNADRASSVGAQTTNQANAIQAYQNNQAALQQAAILDAQAGQNNINNARQSVLDQLNALNMGISGSSQLPGIETAYQQGSGIAQSALTTADASARSAMQAYYDAIAKLADANGNINLQKAQNLSNIMFGNNIPSGVQATVKT
jgi:hypothetical protein